MGAPLGNQNAVKAKRWQQAIDRALEKRSKADGIAELDRLAEKFLDCVDTGAKDFIPGFSALGDRLDGKPAQQVALTGADDGPLVVEIVKFSEPQAETEKNSP
mgnify:CR=1 FL=1